MYILMFVFWIVLIGHIDLEAILLGLVVTAVAAFLMKGLFGYTPSKDLHVVKKAPVFILYAGVLLWEIIKANVGVLALVLKGNDSLEPTIVTFQSPLKTDFGRFLLANSITLTPGTITVETKGDVFIVHCLRRSFLDVSPESTFCRWISRLEA